eukprot:447831_1
MIPTDKWIVCFVMKRRYTSPDRYTRSTAINETKAICHAWSNGYPGSEEGTRKQQLEYLFDQCDSTKTSKEKTRLLKKTNGMISDPITPSFIIKQFKFTVHREALKRFNCLILCEFARQAMVDQMVFSMKLLTHSNAKAVT